MDGHASPAELPELQDWLGDAQGRFRRPTKGQTLERDLTGRLTERPSMNGETLAQAVPDTRARRLQAFLLRGLEARWQRSVVGSRADCRGSYQWQWRSMR